MDWGPWLHGIFRSLTTNIPSVYEVSYVSQKEIHNIHAYVFRTKGFKHNRYGEHWAKVSSRYDVWPCYDVFDSTSSFSLCEFKLCSPALSKFIYEESLPLFASFDLLEVQEIRLDASSYDHGWALSVNPSLSKQLAATRKQLGQSRVTIMQSLTALYQRTLKEFGADTEDFEAAYAEELQMAASSVTDDLHLTSEKIEESQETCDRITRLLAAFDQIDDQ